MDEKKIYRYSEIEFRLIDKEIDFPKEYKYEMDEYWENEIAKGKKYINGKIYTLVGYNFRDDKKILYIQPSSFSHYLFSRQRKYNVYSCRSLAANALLLTTDNYFVLGRMQNTTSLPGRIKFIGGSVSSHDVNCQNIIEMKKCVVRECKEEIGIDILDRELINNVEVYSYITRPHLSFLNTLYLVKLKINKIELQKKYTEFKKRCIENKVEIELANIEFVKNNKELLIEYLKNNSNILSDYMTDFFDAYFDNSNMGDFAEYVRQNLNEITECK